jgi:serine/threonine protein kinase
MLTSTGAKLLDFGLAKPALPLASGATLTAECMHSPVTVQGTIVGTFQYMSPEQVEGKELDGRSDIFSLGAVLYEMLTGRRAFEGKSQLSVASAILETEPLPIHSIKLMTPPALDQVIRRCLAKDPEQRWQSGRDLHWELVWILESASSVAMPPVLSGRQRKGELLAWIAAGVFAVIALAALRLSWVLEERRLQFKINPPWGPISFSKAVEETRSRRMGIAPLSLQFPAGPRSFGFVRWIRPERGNSPAPTTPITLSGRPTRNPSRFLRMANYRDSTWRVVLQ